MPHVEFTLSLKLESEANARGLHWRAKHARVKEIRTWAGLMTKQKMQPWMRDPVVVVVTRLAPRLLDDDNIYGSCKAVRDGIADGLGLKSDRQDKISWFAAQEKAARYSVRILIHPRTAICAVCRDKEEHDKWVLVDWRMGLGLCEKCVSYYPKDNP